ncbi:hypothetical protein KGF54_005008 [Candida jiufengensis]|uniref:uncharacterized protein n=1 Tax=Candida jiufengensis TaxID=497108 RepID=UPI00222464C0|nr:uncharacterized protein KGF54_005008 [Candida jiufengensis]KAI5951933.1 hypothetical protein KGF54_005008 [Candida jiufengensis]
MAKEKRTKPCCNCKRSKVRCVYEENLPCQRCLKTGQAATCQFVPKLPSLRLPSLESSTGHVVPLPLNSHHYPQTQYDSLSTMSNIPSMIPTNNQYLQLNPNRMPLPHPGSTVQLQQNTNTNTNANDGDRMSHMEKKLDSFERKFDKFMDSFNLQQTQYKEPVPQLQQPRTTYQNGMNMNNLINQSPSTNQTPQPEIENYKKRSSTDPETSPRKRISPLHIDNNLKDFRNGFLTKQEATDLFRYFDTNISQQLFGFEISKFRIDDIWESCPVLVCAVSTIASIHHPKLNSKSSQLQIYLRDLCGSLFFANKPKNKSDAFNTIVALILCSFWLSDSQMFTGLALQIAKEYGLNNPNYGQNKEDLKLWYLLYVLDGQQSLAFNRQPLVNSQEYSLKHSRALLVNEDEKKISNLDKQITYKNNSTTKKPSDEDLRKLLLKQKLTDLRLVSQVEYNQALSEAFRGDAWDLLVPSSFGIPSKSNLELDKWMVSWTVLLSPASYGAIWSTKSTLIYYNFAKMHINSSAVRQLTMNPDDENSLPKWNGAIDSNNSTATTPTPPPPRPQPKEQPQKEEDYDSDDSESSQDEEEFISNRELLSPDEAAVNANIALNAAHTVINLVINDKDILDNLKYVPVHVHIMLYYAALLLINPPSKSNNISIELTPELYYNNLLDNLRTINILKRKIYSNLPIDMKFGTRLIKSLEDLEGEKLNEIKNFSYNLKNQDSKNEFDKKIDTFIETSDNIQELMDYNDSGGDSSRASTPLPEKISAWPGSHHGHP